jgi:hypothetical protein
MANGMVATPFFSFKNRLSQSFGPYNRASIGISRCDGRNMPTAAQPLLEKWTTDFWQFAQKKQNG